MRFRTLFLLTGFATIIAFTSCKTAKVIVPNESIRPISTNRLIRNIENNSFEYKNLSVKKISCAFESNGSKTTFKANLQAVYNKKIQLTFSKINVPVGRLLLTPDSVKLINYHEKNYFIGTYDYLTNILNMDLDFETVQSILTNSAFSYRDDKHNNDFREFKSYVDSGMYVLQSVKDRKLEKVTKKGKEKKLNRLLKKLDEEAFIVQTLYIDPSDFNLRKIVFDDMTNRRNATIDFSDFTKVGRQSYPSQMSLHLMSPESDMRLKVKLSKFSTAREKNVSFNIPERFTRIY